MRHQSIRSSRRISWGSESGTKPKSGAVEPMRAQSAALHRARDLAGPLDTESAALEGPIQARIEPSTQMISDHGGSAESQADDIRLAAARGIQGTSRPLPHRSGLNAEGVKQSAAKGVVGSGGPLPHQSTIQGSFGGHDVSGVSAFVGGTAAVANAKMGSVAYATGNAIAFASQPDLYTAAHEATHVVQQRQGVQLSSGVGQVGDRYERHADAVADLVVAGKSAEKTLGPIGGAVGRAVQGRVVQMAPVSIDDVTLRRAIANLAGKFDTNELDEAALLGILRDRTYFDAAMVGSGGYADSKLNPVGTDSGQGGSITVKATPSAMARPFHDMDAAAIGGAMVGRDVVLSHEVLHFVFQNVGLPSLGGKTLEETTLAEFKKVAAADLGDGSHDAQLSEELAYIEGVDSLGPDEMDTVAFRTLGVVNEGMAYCVGGRNLLAFMKDFQDPEVRNAGPTRDDFFRDWLAALNQAKPGRKTKGMKAQDLYDAFVASQGLGGQSEDIVATQREMSEGNTLAPGGEFDVAAIVVYATTMYKAQLKKQYSL